MFAILNLIPVDQWPCQPNYSLDVKSLYIKVAVHIIDKGRGLRLLASCARDDDWPGTDGHLHNRFQEPTVPGLPSCVPNWPRMRHTLPLPGGIEEISTIGQQQDARSGVDPGALHQLENDNTLIVWSRILHKIVAVAQHSLLTREIDVYDVGKMDAFTRFTQQNFKSVDAQTHNETPLDVEWALMTCHMDPDRLRDELTYIKTRYTSWRLLGSPPPSDLVNAVIPGLLGRQVVATANGQFGLAPFGTKCGDHVSTIEGCRVPIILRPIQDNRSDNKGRMSAHPHRYIVIGEAFVQGCDTTISSQDLQPPSVKLVPLRL